MAEKRFDHLWHEAVVVAYGKIQKHARLAGDHVKEVRRNVYRFVAALLQMEKHHQPELARMIESEGKTVTQWMDAHFELIEAMGDMRNRIFSAIEAGVTEKEYVAEAEFAIVRKRVKVHDISKHADGVLAKESPLPAALQDQVAHFRDQYESAKSVNAGLRSKVSKLRIDLGVAVGRVDKLERTIKRLKKDIESVCAA